MTMVIGFSYRRHNPVSWLIQKITRAPFSHTWIGYHDSVLECDMVLEATWPYLTVMPLSVFEHANTVVCTLPSPVDLAPGVRALHEYIGSAYDECGLMGMAWVLLGRYLKRAWKNPFRSKKTMFCSDAVLHALAWAGWEPAKRADPEALDAWDLFEMIAGEVAR